MGIIQGYVKEIVALVVFLSIVIFTVYMTLLNNLNL